jgi:DNA polymerase/3'-5' exonuclease PolX
MGSEKQGSFELALARTAATELALLLAPGCQRIEVAGSIRRGVASVHDIDLVAWPHYQFQVSTNLFGEEQRIAGGPLWLVQAIRRLVPFDDPPTDAKILKFFWNGYPVEIYLAEPDGANFAALWQMRTGSAEFNAWLAGRAKRMGLSYHAGYGIFKLGKDMRFSERVDDGTERGIFRALDLPDYSPAQRSGAMAVTAKLRR